MSGAFRDLECIPVPLENFSVLWNSASSGSFSASSVGETSYQPISFSLLG